MRWDGPLNKVGNGLRPAVGGTNVHTYLRCSSIDTYQVPFTWSGKIKTTKNYGSNAKFVPDGRTVWYDPKLVFHPQYGTDATFAAGNDENVMLGLQDGHTSVSAELRAERPDRPYGTRTKGYESKKVVHPGVVFDGSWHDFRLEVLSHAHYQLWWDGRLMADVVESTPATIKPGRVKVGLRLDFLDVTLADMHVKENGDMSSPFDFSRFDWYPDGLGGPGQVSMSDGRPRPALRTPLDTFAVHYGGAGTQWLDSGDTIEELRGVELNWARPNSKPNEYNSASDIDSETYEYAGPFRAAHSRGNNDTVWGHLALYGLEQLTEDQAQALIAGIRKARMQAVRAGYVTANHEVKGHQELKGASTGCPGPLFDNKRWWAQITAPLTTTPSATPPTSTEEDIFMLQLVSFIRPQRFRNVFAVTPWGSRHLGHEDESFGRLKAQMEAAGVDTTVYLTSHAQEIKGILAQAGLTHSDLVAE
jgi:hypothetical protein